MNVFTGKGTIVSFVASAESGATATIFGLLVVPVMNMVSINTVEVTVAVVYMASVNTAAVTVVPAATVT